MVGIIYCAENNINGKCYIGQTIQKLKYRKHDHLTCKSKWHFHNALKKHNDWNWYIVQEYEADNKYSLKEALNKAEIYYIEAYDSFKSGYNMTLGGGGTFGIRPWLGKKFSKEHRNNLSISHKGYKKKISTLEKISRKVECIETGVIYNSITETKISHVSDVCLGKRKTAGGYRWKFVGGLSD